MWELSLHQCGATVSTWRQELSRSTKSWSRGYRSYIGLSEPAVLRKITLYHEGAEHGMAMRCCIAVCWMFYFYSFFRHIL